MKIAGIGFKSCVPSSTLEEVLKQTGQTTDAITVLRSKAQIPAFQSFAQKLALPVILLDEDDIVGEQTPTFSARIKTRFGTGSVAEALALVVARRYGQDVQLIHPRDISADGQATVAIAETRS
ncbi:cobalamin biosynthesis protein [Epibacterium ulvae]|uniref:Cobalt-precorrin 5A hydrolase n=1 Tax=Epibacterium ulvae TaxID=1156985 RepID=A0A1G5R4U7_9RHOB|nr:cobalamin biosynthesis protein [Epibacterium ulvae]SCZ68878.1 cobalt-precorrin 5A hydrolase [Epibacterium ulvae]